MANVLDRVQRREWVLALTSAMLGLHAVVIGNMLRSTFFIVAFCWGWVAFCALFRRIAAAKAMAATMTALVGGTVIILAASGRMTAPLFALALGPSTVSWACAYLYAVHVEHSATPPHPGTAARRA